MNFKNCNYNSKIVVGIVYPEYANSETDTLIPMCATTYSSVVKIEEGELPYKSIFQCYGYHSRSN